jgi:type II secretory pathway component PulK
VRYAHDERGVVLILVLAILVLLVGSVYAFERRSLLEVSSSRARSERVRAELLARSGVPVALRALADSVTRTAAAAGQARPGETPDVERPEEAARTGRTVAEGNDPNALAQAVDSRDSAWALLSRAPIELPGVGTLHIEVRDGGSRINLNGLIGAEGEPKAEAREFLQEALARAIEQLPGRAEEKLYGSIEDMADAILDWLDADDRTRLNDDENQLYPSRGGGRPPNRPLFALAELATVPRMDGRLLAELEQYFTTQPTHPKEDQGGVNPNTAPPHLLGMIYHGVTGDMRLLQADDVSALLREREDGRLICASESEDRRCVTFSQALGRDGQAFPPISLASQVFEIRSEAKVGETRACVVSVVNMADERGVETLDYRMGC